MEVTTTWEHHNPKIAEPHMKNLLEKLSESSSNWDGFSECNDCMANVSLEYKERINGYIFKFLIH